MKPQIRVARPSDNLSTVAAMYRDGLDLEVLGSFDNHDGFDGVMLGHPECGYHFEFTHHRGHHVGGAPTQDHLLVFYIPKRDAWAGRCERMRDAGFVEVASYNPYWDRLGVTFEDIDGYRVVIQDSRWRAAENVGS